MTRYLDSPDVGLAYARIVRPLIEPSPAWRDLAACKDKDTDLFFPEDASKNPIGVTIRVRAAKAICATCPVQDACYSYALDNNIYYGIWGGYAMSQAARRQRKRRSKLAAVS